MRMLFICNLGRNRSRTAAEAFAHRAETRARGLYSNHVTPDDVAWADAIYVMTPEQRSLLLRMFPSIEKKIILLDIPNVYSYNDPELIALLRKKVLEK